MSRRLPWVLSLAAFAAILLAAAAWSAAHPLPTWWDEALYANQVMYDVVLVRRGAPGIADAFFRLDSYRPPAYRLLVLPATLLFGADLAIPRAVSLVAFAAAGLLLAAAVRRTSGDWAAAIALALIASSPILIWSTRIFGTEYALLLASVAAVVTLATPLPAHSTARWLALGLAVGVGLLAKLTFVLVLLPAVAVAWALAGRNDSVLARRDQVKALLSGGVLAAPWWAHNFSPSLRMTREAARNAVHSLGQVSSPETLMLYIRESTRCGSGFAAAALAIAAIVLLVRRRSDGIPPAAAALALIAAAGAALLPVATYAGGSQNMRYLAPSVILAAAPIAIIIASARRRSIRAAALAVTIVQIAIMSFPRPWSAEDEKRSYVWRGTLETMAPAEQWDWTPLRELAERRGLRNPTIALIGAGYQMNPPHVLHFWTRAGRSANVVLLMGGDRLLERATRADIAVTVPWLVGDPRDRQPPLNAHNRRFVAAAIASGRFEPPLSLDVGVRRPQPVIAFLRR